MNKTSSNFKSKINFVYSDNDSLSVIFQDNDLLMGVVGEFNKNLKELEKLTGTNLYFRGNSIIIKSDQKNNEIVKNAIMFLSDQFINNGSIEKKDILSSINKFMISENSNTGQKIEYIIKTPKKSVIPRSEKQKKYVRALKENEIKEQKKLFGRNIYMNSVIFEGSKSLIGKVVQVRVVKTNQNTLIGEFSNKNKFKAA